MKLTELQQHAIMQMKRDGFSSRHIAEVVLGSKTKKSTVNDFLARNKKESKEPARVLLLDIENQGSLNISFPRFKAFISPDAVLHEPYVLTAAWQWLNESEVNVVGLDDYDSFKLDHRNDLAIISDIWTLLDQADVVIAHNASFDVGVLNSRFIYHGFPPPSPYKVVCTLKALKKYLKLPSNSLDASTKYFELERKKHNDGIKLWVDCFNGDLEAFKKMKEYNHGDIPTLRQLYVKIRPYVLNHPNLSLIGGDHDKCGTCGTGEMKLEGSSYFTNLSEYETYRCNSCGAIKRSAVSVTTKEERKQIKRNAL